MKSAGQAMEDQRIMEGSCAPPPPEVRGNLGEPEKDLQLERRAEASVNEGSAKAEVEKPHIKAGAAVEQWLPTGNSTNNKNTENQKG